LRLISCRAKDSPPDTNFSPLYPFAFLPLIYFLFGINPFAAYAVQVIMGGLCVLLTYLIARKIFGETTALIAAYAHSLYGFFIIFYGALLAEVLINFTFLLALWMFLNALEKQDLRYCILCGLFWGTAILAKPTMAGFIPFLLIPWFLKKGMSLKSAGGIAAMAVCAAAVIAPVTVRNYRITGSFIPVSSGGGTAFIIGNSPQASGSYIYTPFARNVPKEAEGMSAGRMDRYLFGKTIESIEKDPADFLRVIGRKFQFFWGRPEIPNNINYYYHTYNYSRKVRPPVLDFQLLVPWELLVALGITGFMLSLKKWRDALTLQLFALVYPAIIIMLLVMGRFRLPLFPILAIFSAYALQSIVRMAADRRHAAFAGSIAVVAALLFVEYGYARTFLAPAGIYEKESGSILIRDENIHVTGAQFLGSEYEIARKDIVLNYEPGEFKKIVPVLYFKFVNSTGYLKIAVNGRETVKIPAGMGPSGKSFFMNWEIRVPTSSFVRGTNTILMQPCEGAKVYFPYDFSYRYGRSRIFYAWEKYEEKIPGEYVVRLRLEQ